MSLLNLAYRNVAHSREFCSADTGHKLKSCTSMADIRKPCEKNKTVHEECSKSIQPMIEVLNDRTKRVSLKGKQFQVTNPASNEDVEKAKLKSTQQFPRERTKPKI